MCLVANLAGLSEVGRLVDLLALAPQVKSGERG
jgi:hypothetical protein